MLFPSCHTEYWAIILPAAAFLCEQMEESRWAMVGRCILSPCVLEVHRFAVDSLVVVFLLPII